MKKQNSKVTDAEDQQAQDLFQKTMLFGIDSKESLETMSIGLAIAMTNVVNERWSRFLADHRKALGALSEEQVDIFGDALKESIGVGHKMYWTEKIKIKKEGYDNFIKLGGPRFIDHLRDEYARYFGKNKLLELTFPPYLLGASDKFGSTMVNALASQHEDIIHTLVSDGDPKRFAKLFADLKQVGAAMVFSGYVLCHIQDEFIESLGVESDDFEADTMFDADDDLYEDVKEHIAALKTVSTANLQRRFRIGYARASRLLDQLEDDGLISQRDADSGVRKVL